jgi:cobalt-zinc-cadmium efflux system protein
MAHVHDHGPGDDDNERRVLIAMLLTGGFMLAEVAGGLIAGSLALLADAGHMLTDAAALALAWFAFRVARRGHDRKRTYGYHRFQVLAAFVNGLTLILIVGGIAFEAVRRLAEPVEVEGGLMLAIAAMGLVVNILAFLVLHRGSSSNLNIQGAALHVMGDLLGSIAAISAALIILWTGWTPADPLLSLLVAGLIARSAWVLVRKSGHILLEGAPDWLDVRELRDALIDAVPEVEDVHHVHVWMLTSERPLMTLHAVVTAGAEPVRCLRSIRTVLEERYGIGHVTVQIEPGGRLDL